LTFSSSATGNEKYPLDESAFFLPKVRPLDNYARQSRHIATRLIGSTSNHIGSPDVRLSSLKNADNAESKTHLDQETADPFFSYMDTVRVLDSLSLAVVDSNQYKGFLGSSYGRGGVGISVVEPASTAPTPPILDSWNYGSSSNISRMLTGFEEARSNRPQPPSSFYESVPSGAQSNDIHPRMPHSIVHENYSQSDSSQSVVFSASGVSSTQNISFSDNNNTHLNGSVDVVRNDLERISYNQLAPFVWSPFPSSNGSLSRNSAIDESRPASRALVILGTRILDVYDVKSACDLFGSLLYFRPEFCKDRGLIFLAYNDLRSAVHAAHDLKQHIEALAHPRSAMQESLKNNLEVLFCTSLYASSPVDESILLISNLPTNVDEKYFHSMIKSYGMTRSIYFHSDRLDSEGHELVSCTVEFHDIHDARQALLELECSNPSGPVSITHRTRTVNERKMGRELLVLITQWRHGEKPGLSCVFSHQPMSVPSSINASNNNHGQGFNRDGPNSEESSTPGMFSSDSSQRSSKINSSTSGSPTSVHVTHQSLNPLQHQINQVVIGPNGQSYVLVHPNDTSSIGSNLQATQPTYAQPYLAGLPLQPYVNGSESEYAGYHNEGQQVWIQQSQIPLGQAPIASRNLLHPFPCQTGLMHSPGYLNDIAAAPPMSLYYSVRNINDQTRLLHPPTSIPASSNHQLANRKNDQDKQYFSNGMNGSQRQPEKGSLSVSPDDDSNMNLDLNAVKSGTDQRTSVMVRNIPNK